MRAAGACSLSRAAIEEYHLNQVRALLATLLEKNPFYSAKLTAAGVTANVGTLAEFTLRVPFTSRAELVEDKEAHPPYGSNLTCPLQSYTRFHQTSGTTGKPMRWLDTPDAWDSMIDCWIRVFESAGVGPGDRVYFPFSFGPFLGFWLAFDAAVRLGCLSIPGGGVRSTARLQAILENQVTVLCSTPSYAVRLAEVAGEEGLDLGSSKVRTIVVAGEPGGSIPATRAFIEKLWPGARVMDHHGMTETGPVTYGCPVRRCTLHVMEAAYIPEVIEPGSREPVGPGGTGELVLTNLGRMGSPLLRYRTGDLVRRAENTVCDCGSSEMALDGGILARTDGMLIIRGVNVYPSAVEEILRSSGVAEFHVETWKERALEQIRIEIEPWSDHEDLARLEDRAATALRNAFGLRVMVACVPRGTLPRFEGKAARWVRR